MGVKDTASSRAGGGGQFTKFPGYLFRLQKLPWETSFLWKNIAQYSNNALVSSEQFQIGGPISVRGYPVAEYVGDKGFYSSPELSLPIYGLNKDWKVPQNQESWYDTTRIVLFYDWATARLNRVGTGEKKDHTIRGWGYGLRFNLRDNLTFRVEVGYPLGKPSPSDGNGPHTWFEFTSKF
jgi:hemolysin activation/secretion protein